MTMTLPVQPQLWDDPSGPRVRKSDPLTSHAAADSNHDRALVEGAVMRLFMNTEFGFTDSELTIKYFSTRECPNTHVDSPRKRRSDLTGRGLVTDSGFKRDTVTGRKATVWVAS